MVTVPVAVTIKAETWEVGTGTIRGAAVETWAVVEAGWVVKTRMITSERAIEDWVVVTETIKGSLETLPKVTRHNNHLVAV